MEDYDVIIVGAGISGINAAYRIQTQLPGFTYKILEARAGKGGTWDLFKYPGIRSDSDLHTFGFPWAPWVGTKPIVEGHDIKAYIDRTAAEQGIDKKIQYHTKVVSGDWSTKEQRWTIEAEINGEEREYRARFIILGTGYYDYYNPLPAEIPGLKDFKGTIIHPQFWPEDLDYAGKRVVVIGSGATAITLIPSMADKAGHITMLQRSPSYMIALPNRQNPLTSWLPSWIKWRLNRLRFLVVPYLFFRFCRAYPNAARKLMRATTSRQLPKNVPHDPHFEPTYNPWEQRLCVSPDGDFFSTLRSGKADVATGHIKSVLPHSIELQSGQTINADIIVTATGLKVQLAGGAKYTIDGQDVDIPSKFLWKGVMLQDAPNLFFIIGYTNASWTLGADASAQLITRLIRGMTKKQKEAVVARVPEDSKMEARPILNLNSTYIMRAKDSMPKVGNVAPWLPRTNYFSDIWAAKFGDIATGLEFTNKA